MRQNHIEDKTNKEIIKKINGRQYIDVTILVYAQIKKGNNLIKWCLNFLPEIKTLHQKFVWETKEWKLLASREWVKMKQFNQLSFQ